MEKIKKFFESENIEFYATLPASSAQIINPARAHEILGFETVFAFVIPYKTDVSPTRNMARFAAARDYHLYAAELFERFKNLFPDCRCFCDNSPINEKRLAAEAGLGVIGDNSLIINEKYGSYIFLGEIFLKERMSVYDVTHAPKRCNSCGKCKNACPVALDFARCVSAVNQTKKITSEQEAVIRSSQFKWGCDLCQDVCPYNIDAPQTPIEFFRTDIIDTLTPETVDKLIDEGKFKQRPYAWRGVETVKRNLKL